MDKITRHACSDAVDNHSNGVDIEVGEAMNACINVKAI